MWFTTLDGLNRYDGYRFQWFTKYNSDLEYGDVREKFNGLLEDIDTSRVCGESHVVSWVAFGFC